MTADDGYLLDNRQAEAGRRFDAMAELFNPTTFGHLRALGIAPGWRVWEVGAGGASVPDWLAGQVGPSGRVLATDIDLSWLEPAAGRPPERPAYQALRHDVAADPPVAGPFDLVHARLVLVHVPDRARALAAMISVLRPGGWLLVEDADPALQPLACPDEFGPDQRLANELRRGFRQLLAERGADLGYGRTLPRLLRTAGLTGVASDCYFPVGGRLCEQLELATISQLRGRLIEAGLASEQQIERHLATVAAGGLDLATAPLVSAWGRTPTEA
ncbi:MAG: class I SAM-dependent methyltransferase [Jatrophihabitantaceae bacterium]